MRRGSPYGATILGVVLVLAGFVMIALGWKGGAATLFIPTQVAYGMSGGLIGIALIGTGLAVVSVQTSRIATARRTRELQRLVDDTVEVFAAVRIGTDGGKRPLKIPARSSSPSMFAVATTATVSTNGQTAS